ncbi:hypothetical protein HDV06_003695 [Boothiomyces sp. JEL0866]|nr:hypothetical protein HDV06_003695 [Boothiomyces sp. JEL0866]
MTNKQLVLEAIENQDYERIAAVEDDHPDILKSRIISLIKMDKFQEALDIVPDDPEFCVEHAYILYKTDLNQCVEFVSQRLGSNPSNILDSKLMTIQAQAYYKLEQFEEAIRIYEQLDLDSDIKTNIMASVASSKMFGNSVPVNDKLDNSYSFLFNLANSFISDQEFPRAITTLEAALDVCQSTMMEQQYEQFEIDLELGTIKSQLGLAHYLNNNHDEAKRIFESVLELSYAIFNISDLDPVVALITNINLSCLKNDQNLSQQLLSDISESITHKLNSHQNDLLAFNKHMVAILGSKSASKLDALQARFKDDERVILLEASLQMKKKDANQAIVVAQGIVEKYPQSLNAHLVLLQKYIQQSQFEKAELLLNDMISSSNFEKSKPGLISLAIWVLRLNDKQSEALGLIEQTQPTTRKEVLQLADLKLQFGYLDKAKENFEELLKEDPTDTKSIAGYILTLPETELEVAEQYLPYITNNVEFPYKDHSVELDVLPGKVITKEQKKKRKRNKPLPKNYDPKKQPDPERWLPKSQRTGKKAKTTGFQGVALEGGGIGSTGSARIAGMDPTKLPAAPVEAPKKELPQPAVKTPAGLRKKKNKK